MNIPRTKEGYIEYSYGGCKSRFYFNFFKKVIKFCNIFFHEYFKDR